MAGEESSSSSSARRKRETLKRQDTPIHPDIVTNPATALIRRPTVLKSLSAAAQTGGGETVRFSNPKIFLHQVSKIFLDQVSKIFLDQVSLALPSNPACSRSSSCDERLKSPAPRPLSHAVKTSQMITISITITTLLTNQGRQHNTENLAVSNRSFPLSGIRYHLKYIFRIISKYKIISFFKGHQ